jgi:hypothetical protein
MDLFASFGSVLAAIAALVSIFSGIKGWILTAEEDRQKVIDWWKKLLTATGVVGLTLLFFAVVLVSAWQVYEFAVSEAPITRKDVLMLIIHIFNFGTYLTFTVAVPVAVKAVRKRNETYRCDSQT